MNEQAMQLIRELAAKLGTTTEHLWGVLIRQAPISALCDLVEPLVWLVFALIYTKWYTGLPALKKEKVFPFPLSNPEGEFQWEDKAKAHRRISLRIFGLILWGIFLLALLFTNYSNIAAGFFNPEYWALKQLWK